MKTLSLNNNLGTTVNYLTDLIDKNEQFTVLQIITETNGVTVVGLTDEVIRIGGDSVKIGVCYMLEDFKAYAREFNYNLIETSEENPLPIYLVDNFQSSSWTPLSIVSKVLFWGKVSEISGGQMPNKVTGATDYLTVAGSPYTFQTPNTAAYINADTDYIWFKTNAEQRTTTTAELIGYDLQRTPVKYGDVSPNTLTEIVILKAGEVLTASEINSLHAYIHLSMFWSGVENDYGYLKDNRVGQQLWTPESVQDTDLTAWLARMPAQPSAAQIVVLQKDFEDLKSAGLYAKGDVIRFYHLHSEAESLQNIKGNTNLAALVGTPAFTAYSGWKSNGAAHGIDENFIPSSNGGLFVQDSASLLVYIKDFNSAETNRYNGVNDGTSFISWGESTAGHGICRINEGTGASVDKVPSNGGNGIVRTGANATVGYNGSTNIAGTGASNGLPTRSIHTLCYNNNGTIGYGAASHSAQAVFIGEKLTPTEKAAWDAIVAYHVANFIA